MSTPPGGGVNTGPRGVDTGVSTPPGGGVNLCQHLADLSVNRTCVNTVLTLDHTPCCETAPADALCIVHYCETSLKYIKHVSGSVVTADLLGVHLDTFSTDSGARKMVILFLICRFRSTRLPLVPVGGVQCSHQASFTPHSPTPPTAVTCLREACTSSASVSPADDARSFSLSLILPGGGVLALFPPVPFAEGPAPLALHARSFPFPLLPAGGVLAIFPSAPFAEGTAPHLTLGAIQETTTQDHTTSCECCIMYADICRFHMYLGSWKIRQTWLTTSSYLGFWKAVSNHEVASTARYTHHSRSLHLASSLTYGGSLFRNQKSCRLRFVNMLT